MLMNYPTLLYNVVYRHEVEGSTIRATQQEICRVAINTYNLLWHKLLVVENFNRLGMHDIAFSCHMSWRIMSRHNPYLVVYASS